GLLARPLARILEPVEPERTLGGRRRLERDVVRILGLRDGDEVTRDRLALRRRRVPSLRRAVGLPHIQRALLARNAALEGRGDVGVEVGRLAWGEVVIRGQEDPFRESGGNAV